MERVRFFNAVEALPSLRDLGITEDEGVCELIDNSFDVNCKEVRIHLEKKNDGNFKIIVADDGEGVPTTYGDFQGIPYVLAVGGKVPKGKSRIGRFGWGLSATATCLTTRTSVYSKHQDDVSWRKGVYDIQQLSDTDDCTMDNEVLENPPWIDLPQTGTIVVLENIDRCRYTRLGDLKNNLVKNLGRIYRKMLGAGKSIVVSWEESEGKIKDTDENFDLFFVF